MWPARRQRSEAETCADREREARQREFRRGGEPPENEAHGPGALVVGTPPVAQDRLAHEQHVLHGTRLIETEPLALLGNQLRRGIRAQEHGRGIAREHANDHENDRQRAPHNDESGQQAPGEEPEHYPLRRCAGVTAKPLHRPRRRSRWAAP